MKFPVYCLYNSQSMKNGILFYIFKSIVSEKYWVITKKNKEIHLPLCVCGYKFVVYSTMSLPLSILDKCFHPTLTKYRLQKSKLYCKYKQLKRAVAAGQENPTTDGWLKASNVKLLLSSSGVFKTNIPNTQQCEMRGKWIISLLFVLLSN